MPDYSGVTPDQWKAAFSANPDAWKQVLTGQQPYIPYQDGRLSLGGANSPFMGSGGQPVSQMQIEDMNKDDLFKAGFGLEGWDANPYYSAAGVPTGQTDFQSGEAYGTQPTPQMPVDTDFAGGMPRGVRQTGTGEWDWSQFGSGTQSVDPGYQSNAAPVESPWQGGGINQDFYNQQFGQLLNQSNAFQDQQSQAQQIRQDAADAPQQDFNPDWSWVDGGLPEVQVVQGDSDNPYTWDRRGGITPGQTTNAQVVDILASDGVLGQADKAFFENMFKSEGVNPESTYWASKQFSNPDQLLAAMSANKGEAGWAPGTTDAMTALANNMWLRSDITTPPGGGPTGLPGYALPVGATTTPTGA